MGAVRGRAAVLRAGTGRRGACDVCITIERDDHAVCRAGPAVGSEGGAGCAAGAEECLVGRERKDGGKGEEEEAVKLSCIFLVFVLAHFFQNKKVSLPALEIEDTIILHTVRPALEGRGYDHIVDHWNQDGPQAERFGPHWRCNHRNIGGANQC